MKQVVQPVSGGPVQVVDVPRPAIEDTEVLVQTIASVISPGTERMVTSLAQASLVGKAKARPDLVRRVLKKAKTEGIASAVNSVRSRLDSLVPLGYSASGRVLEVGAAVTGLSPGDLVATAGAGKATHAEYQAVPHLLCAKVPHGLDPADAAFATLGAIALHGLRQSEAVVGSNVVVVGLGLMGQLTVRIAGAAGCQVAALDIVEDRVELARHAGAEAAVDRGDDTTRAIRRWSEGMGADVVIVTAADRTSGLIRRIPAFTRDRAVVVVVGDIGLDLDRTPFYEQELQLRFARSYGPGRYDFTYEGLGVDYPDGYVRWTAGRNLEAVLKMMAAGHLQVSDLVTHRFNVSDAADAYEILEKQQDALAIQIAYPTAGREDVPVELTPGRPSSARSIGLIGAGNFASSVLVPSLKSAGFSDLIAISSASGLSARSLGQKHGFTKAVGGSDAVIGDPDVDLVVIATRHDSHAELATIALKAGKDVFCEKPLAISEEELDELERVWRQSGRVLFAGFNRRWSRPIVALSEHFAERSGPLSITYRVNAGEVPEGHWYHDRRQGGRLLGEVCHFIDTCSALVGAHPEEITAVGDALGIDQVAVSLRYPDSSVAAITYGSGAAEGTPKERIEVLGRGRSAIVDDFRRIYLDGRVTKISPQDKGHAAEMKALARALDERSAEPGSSAIATTRATLRAAASAAGS